MKDISILSFDLWTLTFGRTETHYKWYSSSPDPTYISVPDFKRDAPIWETPHRQPAPTVPSARACRVTPPTAVCTKNLSSSVVHILSLSHSLYMHVFSSHSFSLLCQLWSIFGVGDVGHDNRKVKLELFIPLHYWMMDIFSYEPTLTLFFPLRMDYIVSSHRSTVFWSNVPNIYNI